METREARLFECELRAEESQDRGHSITGRPIVYSQRTNIGPFDEIIEPGALALTDLNDVRMLVGHNKNGIPVARSRKNRRSTMQLMPNMYGLDIHADLDTENNTEAMALYSAVKRGDISGMSFAFVVGNDRWDGLDTDHPTRHILSIRCVFEVSAVTFPAYEGTSMEARIRSEAQDSAKALLERARRAAASGKQRAEEEQRARDDVASGNDSTLIEKMNEEKRKMEYTINSPEYRNAFLKALNGIQEENWTKEERAAYAANTGDTTHGAALLLPTQMLNNIWSLVEEQHSILGDITMYRTNTIMTIPVHSAVSQGDAAAISENTAATDEINDWTTVTLHGVDYSKTLKITYAMAAMSLDALENYLTNEIAARLGAAMAKDTVTGILSNYYTTDATFTVTGALKFTDVAKAFGALKNPNGQATVYANNKTLCTYLVGMVDSYGRPIYQHDVNEGVQGRLIGYPVKVEDAMSDGDMLIGYPKNVVGNVVQDVMVEADRDIIKHVIVYSGYARYESVLVAPKSFAKISVTAGT